MAAFYAERARGGVGLIVTGGISPNDAGRGYPFAAKLSTAGEARPHQVVTQAVHDEGGKILMQILHTGRYAYTPFAVAPSRLRAPIGWVTPAELTSSQVERTIADYARSAELAKSAGYDGVEIMGSEGYLINQFIVDHTNKRTDEWGGSYEKRIRFPLEIIRETRKAVGPDFILMYRLSMLDLVPRGSTWEEVSALASAVEDAGATIINTGIGWHEARVPTIATKVPRAGFTWVTRKLKQSGAVSLPLVTTNRINMPGTAEDVLARGDADLISMARPFLADPDLLVKAQQGRADEINTCIGCNQACLDHTFQARQASCLVNPRACYETELNFEPVRPDKRQRIAVVGSGPAGLAAATVAAERGHKVTLIDSADRVGGQFNLAKRIPGKEEFYETIRYFRRRLEVTGVGAAGSLPRCHGSPCLPPPSARLGSVVASDVCGEVCSSLGTRCRPSTGPQTSLTHCQPPLPPPLLALLCPPRARAPSGAGGREAQHAGDRERPAQCSARLRPSRARHGDSPAHPPHPRRRPAARAQLCGRALRAHRGGQAGGHNRGRRDWLRRVRVPRPPPRGGRAPARRSPPASAFAALPRRVGHRWRQRGTRRPPAWRAPATGARAGDHAAPAEARQARRHAGQDDGLDPPLWPQGAGRGYGGGRYVQAHRRGRCAYRGNGEEGAGARGARHPRGLGDHLCGARAAARALRGAQGGRHAHSPYRRRRARWRTRCQASHRSGLAPRRCH
mmetsp:Transcript_18886/g.59858  ORF Transcript_18886/g.59858 Transcript_18886/m.59858 type:complete len:736 (+) Transcript_18886:129-2336(+)